MDHAKKRGMYGHLKSFDRDEHRTYDSKGKRAALDAIRNHLDLAKGLRTIENPDRYGIDLLTLNENDEVVACWEVEVRHGNWSGNRPFPFREINCIERKDHQWRKDDSFLKGIPYKTTEELEVFYMQLNRECNRAVIIKGDTVLKYPLKPWRNRKASGEFVRQVPVTQTRQITF